MHDKPDAGSPAQPQALRVAVIGRSGLRSASVAALLKRCDERVVIREMAAPAELRAEHAVHLALLPLLCPHATALSEVSGAVRALGNVPLAVLVDHGEAQVVQHLASVGVRGVLTLDLDINVVAPALRLVASGGVYLPPQPDGRPLSPLRPADTASLPTSPLPAGLLALSPRERVVLDLLGRSLSNREIAAALGIAEATVKIHVRNLLRKTRARNRVELALMAARRA